MAHVWSRMNVGHCASGVEVRAAEMGCTDMGPTDMGRTEMRGARVRSAEMRPAAMPATPTGMAAGMTASWLGGEACPGRQTQRQRDGAATRRQFRQRAGRAPVST